jgi:hypothetical protein
LCPSSTKMTPSPRSSWTVPATSPGSIASSVTMTSCLRWL